MAYVLYAGLARRSDRRVVIAAVVVAGKASSSQGTPSSSRSRWWRSHSRCRRSDERRAAEVASSRFRNARRWHAAGSAADFRTVMRDVDSRRFLSFGSLVTSKAAARQLLEETIVAYDSPEPRLAYAVELRMLAIFVGLAGISWLSSAGAEIMYHRAALPRSGTCQRACGRSCQLRPGRAWRSGAGRLRGARERGIQAHSARLGVSRRRPDRSSRLRRTGGEVRAR